MDRDMERSEKIISAIKQNGFITKDNTTTYIHYKDEDRGIKKIDYKFEYPDEAIDLLILRILKYDKKIKSILS